MMLQMPPFPILQSTCTQYRFFPAFLPLTLLLLATEFGDSFTSSYTCMHGKATQGYLQTIKARRRSPIYKGHACMLISTLCMGWLVLIVIARRIFSLVALKRMVSIDGPLNYQHLEKKIISIFFKKNRSEILHIFEPQTILNKIILTTKLYFSPSSIILI